MKLIGVIPARYGSSRFPGKPLALVAGKPLLQHVIERCKLARSLQEVIVATDDERIRKVAVKLCRVEMTFAATPIKDVAEYESPNVVKVVVNVVERALYFSRRTIPYVRDAASSSQQMAAFTFL